MAPERRTESSSRAIIVDLTFSDDEEDIFAMNRPEIRHSPVVVPRVLTSVEAQSWESKPILPPPRPPSVTTNRHSSLLRKSLDHIPSYNRPKHFVEELENPAKRRKTQNGPQNPDRRNTPILPPTPTYRRDQVQTTLKPVNSTVRTIIGGVDREKSSKLSNPYPGGRIQECLTSTIEKNVNEVFKHVNTSLSRYEGAISVQQRRVIGQKASNALVDPSLFQELTGDPDSLPEQYGIVLAEKAKAYVDRFAGQALDHSVSGSSAPEDVLIRQIQVLQQSSDASDSDIFESEDTFEGTAQPLPARKYSSSPTTSFDQTADAEPATESAKASQTGKESEQSKIPGGTVDLNSRLRRRVRTKPSLFDIRPEQAQRPKASVFQSKTPVVELPRIDRSKFRKAIPPKSSARILTRPYLEHHDREALRLGLESSRCRMSREEQDFLQSSAIHLDFSLEELKIILVFAMSAKGHQVSRVDLSPDLPQKITSLLQRSGQKTIDLIHNNVKQAVDKIGDKDKGIQLLQERSDSSIRAFLKDACSSKIAEVPQRLQLDVKAKRKAPLRLSTLLFQREVSGLAPHRICGGKESFNRRITSLLEDEYIRQSEWTDCCGDITAITWTSKTTFICGATAHSDLHNMQYNKPGNLVLGSTTLDTLRALPNHRVVRPQIAHEENAENALESMRNTQDPWIYTSVVSTAYCQKSGLAFTASFDQTVKVWSIADDGSQMELKGAWYHEGKVNFVVASDHHSRVATACDVITNSVRVYSVGTTDVTEAAYDIYCGERARAQGTTGSEKWAYFPATIQWGKSVGVADFLLVGFSPRALTGYDQDIPEDKRDTGELCLWNVDQGSEITIHSTKLQNAFEVLWHPSQPIFLAATSPCGIFDPLQTKTQIRMFAQTANGSFVNVKALDCPAMDINELTIMPNSRLHSYVTASCTDGNTYVYDTALGDHPIHILQHGESLDSPLHDIPREQADTGVKFAAWGQNMNRFYTGASDGKVKAWDVTAPPCHAFVRNVLVVAGGVSAGAFSTDHSQLVVGDATGKVHLVRIDDSDIEEGVPPVQARNALQARGKQSLQNGAILPAHVKRPKVVIPHAEPAPPKGHVAGPNKADETGQDIAREFIDREILVHHPDPRIGVVQGPRYPESNLFLYEAHQDFDGNAPLLPEWQIKQHSSLPRAIRETSIEVLPNISQSSNAQRHRENLELDLSLNSLSLETKEQMRAERWEMEWDPGLSHRFDDEISPGNTFDLFKNEEKEEGQREKRFWESLFQTNYLNLDGLGSTRI